VSIRKLPIFAAVIVSAVLREARRRGEAYTSVLELKAQLIALNGGCIIVKRVADLIGEASESIGISWLPVSFAKRCGIIFDSLVVSLQ